MLELIQIDDLSTLPKLTSAHGRNTWIQVDSLSTKRKQNSEDHLMISSLNSMFEPKEEGFKEFSTDAFVTQQPHNENCAVLV